MASIILSIHKSYTLSLFAGEKICEFRKSVPSRPVSLIFVYEARGCGKIIGELIVAKTLVASPEEIWEQTKDMAGIDRESFFKYFKGKERAVAYIISSYTKYEKPKLLSEFGISRAPQNYIWVEPNFNNNMGDGYRGI